MFQQMIETLADVTAGGRRKSVVTAAGLMQETADRFGAPTGDERVDPSAPAPELEVEDDGHEDHGEDSPTDRVRDPDGHTHSSGGSLAWGGYQNGRIPSDALASIGGGHKLESTAAEAWQDMVAAAKAEGVDLTLTDSYRSFDAQVSARKRKGHKVATATPGTSIHGWGKAIDVAGDDARRWIQENGESFGWVWPDWAQREGTKSFEPWHFEYRPGSN